MSDFADAVAEAVNRFQVERLAGLTVDDARAIVEGAGGNFQPYEAGQPLTLDFRTDRVRALVDGDLVVEARVG